MKVAKEIFIMALLLMIVVFMIGLVFYEYMPNNKIIPDPVTYAADGTTTAILQEISATSTSDGEDEGNDSAGILLQSYSIGAQELSTAASKNAYKSGKTDPFAEWKEPDPNSVNATNTANTTATNTTGTTAPQKAASSSNSSNTGSFFEKPNSK